VVATAWVVAVAEVERLAMTPEEAASRVPPETRVRLRRVLAERLRRQLGPGWIVDDEPQVDNAVGNGSAAGRDHDRIEHEREG